MVAALKSEENEDAQTQNAFITVFTLDGEVLLEETEVRCEVLVYILFWGGRDSLYGDVVETLFLFLFFSCFVLEVLRFSPARMVCCR